MKDNAGCGCGCLLIILFFLIVSGVISVNIVINPQNPPQETKSW